ncbi:hypothetical protein B0I35DRAFT_442424 [Stachybotrys elegans]|uniref:Uncharacterized protein n=1 Tax=Stachybotrys elegans TaxID=80388 RepID=A0A8K0SGL3_9HYPO|nr:hypothetical protein B0I35DRAFT_442424 [Stachybotrys elegans]
MWLSPPLPLVFALTHSTPFSNSRVFFRFLIPAAGLGCVDGFPPPPSRIGKVPRYYPGARSIEIRGRICSATSRLMSKPTMPTLWCFAPGISTYPGVTLAASQSTFLSCQVCPAG